MGFDAKTLTRLCGLLAAIALAGSVQSWWRCVQIERFNAAIVAGSPPASDTQSFEARFAAAYWLAKKGYYKESSQLFSRLAIQGTPRQRAIAKFNLGNIFLLRGLAIYNRDLNVRNESEYLFQQAHNLYRDSLRLYPDFWQARHNMDRTSRLVPHIPTPGVGESENPGIIMGNIPVGLP